MPIVPPLWFNQMQNQNVSVPPSVITGVNGPSPGFHPGPLNPVPAPPTSPPANLNPFQYIGYSVEKEWNALSVWGQQNMNAGGRTGGAASVVSLITNPIGWYNAPKASWALLFTGWAQSESSVILNDLGGPTNPWARGTSNAFSALTSYVGGLGGAVESMVNPYTPNLIGALSKSNQKQYLHDNPYYNIGSYVGEMALILPGAESLVADARAGFATIPRSMDEIGSWLKTGFLGNGEKMATVTKWAEYPLSTKSTYLEELSPKGLFTQETTEIGGKIFKVGTERLPRSELYDVRADFGLLDKTNVKGGAEFGGYKISATTIQPGSLVETNIIKSEKGNVRSFQSITDTLFPKAKTFKYSEESMSLDGLVTSPEKKTFTETQFMQAKPVKLGVGYRLGKAFSKAMAPATKSTQPDWTPMQAGYLNENLGASLDKFNIGLDKKISSFSSGVSKGSESKAAGGQSTFLEQQPRARQYYQEKYLYTVDLEENSAFREGLSLAPLMNMRSGAGLNSSPMSAAGQRTKTFVSTGTFSGLGQQTKTSPMMETSMVNMTALKTNLRMEPISISMVGLKTGVGVDYGGGGGGGGGGGTPSLRLEERLFNPPRRSDDLFSFASVRKGGKYSEKKNPFNMNFLRDIK